MAAAGNAGRPKPEPAPATPPRNGAAGRRWLGPLLRLVVSSLLLAWLARTLQGGWQRLEDIDPGTLWLAALVFAASTVLGALQWGLLLRHAGLGMPLLRLGRIYWVGLFFNNFLPGNVGGDVVKVTDVAVRTGRVALPVAGTLLDRVLGLAALLGLAFLAAVGLRGTRPAGLPWQVLVVAALGVLVLGAGLLSRRFLRALVRGLIGLSRVELAGRLQRLGDELATYRHSPRLLLRILLLALVVQSLRVLTHLAVARAMGIALPAHRILELFVLIPVLGLAMVLPVSFNGLGVRELVATRLLPAVGISAQEAFALELATYLVQVGVSLAGGVLFAAGAWRARGARQEVGSA